MLAADRSAVETELQAQAIQIKNIEMNNIDRYLQAIGTQAALICGFAAGESFCVELSNATPWYLITGYYFCNVFALILEMYCVMNATLVSVLGPTFALNGPQGSMHASVKCMKEERLQILSAFWSGALSFGAAQMFAVWIIAPAVTAVTANMIMVLGFVVINKSMERIKVKFKFEEIYAGDDDGKGNFLKDASPSGVGGRRASGLSALLPVTLGNVSNKSSMRGQDFITRAESNV
ncbi:hypothetical protein ScalyP_jg1352 [Parmales sp. scaly parma]|nr:hypothetical protein ScalyP_jg1352 [Parmales sp. scaly parma]|tara:strand:+ start:122 stop:826 length:705 start_codon:yes stop_codon:yes gene_type:complete